MRQRIIKNSKHLRKTFLLFCASIALVFSSCESDEEGTIVDPIDFEAVVTLNATGDIETIREGEGTVRLVVSFTEALPFDAAIGFNVESSDGTVTLPDGTLEYVLTGDFNLPAGQTEAVFDLSFVDDQVLDIENYTITLETVKPTNSDFPDRNYIIPGENLRLRLQVADDLPTFTTTPGDVEIQITFDSGLADFDMFGVIGNLNPDNVVTDVFDFSNGVSNTESITLPSSAAFGDYSIFITNFNGLYPLNCDLFEITFPDGQMYVSENIEIVDQQIPGLITGGVIYYITKVEDLGGNVQYVILPN